jgi:hypothetical protein
MSADFQRGLLRAIAICELYADESIRMASDTVACDPILNPKARARIRNRAELEIAQKVSEELELDGFEYASKHVNYRLPKQAASDQTYAATGWVS